MSLVPIKFFMACYIRTDCVPNDPFPLTPFPVQTLGWRAFRQTVQPSFFKV